MTKVTWWSFVRIAGFAVGNLALLILWIVNILNPAFGRGASYQFIFLFVILVTVVLGSMNAIANKKLLVSDYFFFGFAVFGIIAAVLLIIADKPSVAAVFAILAVLGLIASKAGVFIWASALLPALKAIPAAISGYYAKKLLDERGKKKKLKPPAPIAPSKGKEQKASQELERETERELL